MSLTPELQQLMLAIRNETGVSLFVETGTYYGQTAQWAANHFDRVITCEASRELYNLTHAGLSKKKRIEHHFGHSLMLLPGILESLKGSALFWIDSHWSAGETYGENDECPLLGELEGILANSIDHYLFIDDASYFCSPPPAPHNPAEWPDLLSISILIGCSQRYRYVIFNNALIVFPQNASEQFFGLLKTATRG